MLRLLKEFEGLRLEAYRCPAGVWTIGYGHTAGVKPGDFIDVDEAERLLWEDVRPVMAEVDAMGVELSFNQRRALVSFVFNVGIAAFRESTLRCKVIADPSDPAIAAEFGRWVFGGGRRLPGLERRRAEEARVYFL